MIGVRSLKGRNVYSTNLKYKVTMSLEAQICLMQPHQNNFSLEAESLQPSPFPGLEAPLLSLSVFI